MSGWRCCCWCFLFFPAALILSIRSHGRSQEAYFFLYRRWRFLPLHYLSSEHIITILVDQHHHHLPHLFTILGIISSLCLLFLYRHHHHQSSSLLWILSLLLSGVATLLRWAITVLLLSVVACETSSSPVLLPVVVSFSLSFGKFQQFRLIDSKFCFVEFLCLVDSNGG